MMTDLKQLREALAYFEEHGFSVNGYGNALMDAATAHANLLADIEAHRKFIGEWQPIEAAPRSGRQVILSFRPDDRTQVTGFFRDGKWICSGLFYEHSAGKPPYAYRQFEISDPTHWTPLPTYNFKGE